MLKEIKTIKGRVEILLRDFPEARSCDKILWVYYMVRYHDLENKVNQFGFKAFLSVTISEGSPSYEGIARARRLLQAKSESLRGENYELRLMEADNVRASINKL